KEQGVVLRLENYIEEAVQRPKQPAEDSPPRNAAQNVPYIEGGEPDARAGRDQVGGSERQMLRERDKQQEEQRDRGPAQGILDRMHGHPAQDLEEKERNEGQERAHEARVGPVGRHLDVGGGADREKQEAIGAQ